MTLPTWLSYPLSELDSEQWELLCDSCGKCCMAKLQDDETNKIYSTNVACRFMDMETCRCSDYANRTTNVPTCHVISLEKLGQFEWLPETCAYRLRLHEKPLPPWHPLITGDSQSVHRANISVKNKCISELDAGPLEHHLVDW
ncbi:MAG: YcgN family cysteine cluster protein [Pseudomonadota bacterium]